MPSGLSILVVDDEPSIRRSLALCLQLEGHAVHEAANAEQARKEAFAHPPAAVFLDLRLGATSGLDLIPVLLQANPLAKIVVITAYASVDTAVEAMRRGAFDYLPKPFEPSQVVQAAAKIASLVPVVHVDGLVSRNAQCNEAYQMAKQVAGAEVRVLITGESGTGKTRLARSIHAWSSRKDRPFGTVACPNLPGELLESELFGHVRGAFTGAVEDRKGRVEVCEGGTLFLDEVGDLPLAIQPRLLRFLQEREYERLGDSASRKSDVRVISATSRNLSDQVKAGAFREDLLYRLNVVEIRMPPLRERLEDLPELLVTLLREVSGQNTALHFSEAAIEVMRAHLWPGNLRELANVVERAAVLSTSDRIGPERLPFGGASRPAPENEASLPLDRLEELHIRRVVASANTLEDAARVLGIDVATLWRKRKRYGI